MEYLSSEPRIIQMKKSIHSSEQKDLQDLLRKLRIEAGLCQSDLARVLDRSQSFVSKYEAGDRCLDILELRSVCKALGTSLPEFIKTFEKIIS